MGADRLSGQHQQGTNKVDYGTSPFPRVLLDAVNRIVHPRYRGEPWLTSATFEL